MRAGNPCLFHFSVLVHSRAVAPEVSVQYFAFLFDHYSSFLLRTYASVLSLSFTRFYGVIVVLLQSFFAILREKKLSTYARVHRHTLLVALCVSFLQFLASFQLVYLAAILGFIACVALRSSPNVLHYFS